MRGRRRATASMVVGLAIVMTGCSQAMPESVVPGTEVVVGWDGAFTSANAAASPTSGNVDVAAMTRAGFGDVVDGEFVADEGFGTVTIVGDEPFTVRYDLTEPSWSDGIPLDAADLLLGWAGSAGYFADEDEGEPDAATPDPAEATAPTIDEFARAIDVTYAQPTSGWQSAVTVPVPAHVLGARALGIDDAMEAKQAVITAIQNDDQAALQKMTEAWNSGFEFGESDVPDELLLSSGPFRVDEARAGDDGRAVTLVPNESYRGAETPQVARVELVPSGEDPVAALGDGLDVAQVAPVAANQSTVHDLERKDFTVSTTHDGTVWAVLLHPSGVFSTTQARTAFLHSAQPTALKDGGAGAWTASYMPTTSMTAGPESRAYEVVNEDSGFTRKLGSTEGEPPLEREAAGIAAGARVCVLYDRGSEFAIGVFAALKAAAAEAGWSVFDCGADDFDAALTQRSWNAVITRVPIPETPAEIADQWGSEGTASLTGQVDADRDALIAQLAETIDVYEAREVRAQIEATIVEAAVALPLAANPVLTITDRDVTGVSPRNGSVAPLTSGAVQWLAAP